ncbi:hypothetical protein GCM10023238_20120 [Streptomyces heliomycini]
MEPLEDLVAFLPAPLGEGEAGVEGLARPARQRAGLPLVAGQPAHRLGPLPRQPPDHVPLVEHALRVAREQQP